MTTPKKSHTASESPGKPYKVFVVSPIGAKDSDQRRDADYALKYVFRAALEAPGWELHRADEGNSPDSIGARVIESIYDADLIIADLTGHNPNVFYELALAHGWRKPVVHVAQLGTPIPFDVVDQRTIFYDLKDLGSVEEAIDALRKSAKAAVSKADFVNPFTTFEAFQTLRNPAGTSETASEAEEGAVAYLLQDISSQLRSIDHRIGDLEKNDKRRNNYPGLVQALDVTSPRAGLTSKYTDTLAGLPRVNTSSVLDIDGILGSK